MAKIRIIIEPTWTRERYTDVIEVHDVELEGLGKQGRSIALTELAEDAVDSLIEWGWEEIEEPGHG